MIRLAVGRSNLEWVDLAPISNIWTHVIWTNGTTVTGPTRQASQEASIDTQNRFQESKTCLFPGLTPNYAN